MREHRRVNPLDAATPSGSIAAMAEANNGSQSSPAEPGSRDPFDPRKLVADSPSGSVVYGFSFDPDLQIDFLIREQTSVINQMMLEPRLDTRAGALLQNDVLIGVVLFTFNRHLAVYRTFWNYHEEPVATEDPHHPQQNTFDLMTTRTDINYFFVGDTGEFEYQLRAPHRLQGFFAELRDKARSMKPWTREQFVEEKRAITEAVPDPMRMWKDMSSPSAQG
jgi:hypothetical protein